MINEYYNDKANQSLYPEFFRLGKLSCASDKFEDRGMEYAPIKDEITFDDFAKIDIRVGLICLLYTSPSPRDKRQSRMPSSA